MSVFRRLPLTTKIVLLTVFVGLITWGLLESLQNQRLKSIFETQLTRQLEVRAQEARVRFDNYVNAYNDAAEITVSQKRFTDYIGKKAPSPSGRVKYYREVPPWLPERSVLRRLVRVSYACLMDGGGNVIEVYQGIPEPIPPVLLKPGALLRSLSFNQSLMTKIEGTPFVLTAKPVFAPGRRIRAVLMFASPLDDDFLADSQGFAGPTIGMVILISKDRIIASSRPDVLPGGTPLSEARRNFLIMGKSFFDTGSSDLLIEFASLISKNEYEALGKEVLTTGRTNRLMLALTFIIIFSVVMSRITRRIEGLTRRISDFSEKKLGGVPLEPGKGDQLDILDRSFHRLTEEVVTATERLRRAREELELRVEERTAELRESERFMETIFETAPACIKLVAADGALLRMNRAGLAMIGADSLEQVKGRSLYPLVSPPYLRAFKDLTREVFQGKSGTLEFEMIGLTGGRLWLNTHAVPLYNDKKEIFALLGITLDITERKKAEEEIKSLFSTLNTLVEHMPEGVLLLDEEDRIVLANPVGAQHIEMLSGTRQGEVLENIGGRPITDLLVSPPLIMWHDVTARGRIYEVAGRKMDSRGMVFAIRDVTEERLVKERTQMHERLAAVGQMAAGVAHDFNNILTVITGYAEMLLEGGLSTDARKKTEAIYQAGQRASELIGQILDFSRKTVGELKPLDMAAFVRDFIKFIERTIPENIDIKFKHPAGKYTVRGDATKLQQVLANLAVNARDAMPEGGELIFEVSSSSLADGEKQPLPDMQAGDWVTLAVEDTGTGITPEALSHIFEPFYSTKGAGGTGLGLSQVYGIVRQHDGFIDVKTEVGKGSSFTIYLPAVSESVELLPAERTEAASRGHGETILIAEDNESVLGYLRLVLSDLGYKILTAENGNEALKLFVEHESEIKLVLTDVIMPEMGGLRLSAEIHKRSPGMRVIALSSYLPIREREFQEAGFENFIKKPFKASTLAKTIQEALVKPYAVT